MTDTTSIKILAGVTELANQIFEGSEYFPLDEVEIETARSTGCTSCISDTGIVVATGTGNAFEIAGRIIHAAAHAVCREYGMKSHETNGRHTAPFWSAVSVLGGLPDPSNSLYQHRVQLAPETLERVRDAAYLLAGALKKRPSSTAPARVTLRCPFYACEHTVSLRAAAAAKSAVLCRAHAEEMTP